MMDGGLGGDYLAFGLSALARRADKTPRRLLSVPPDEIAPTAFSLQQAGRISITSRSNRPCSGRSTGPARSRRRNRCTLAERLRARRTRFRIRDAGCQTLLPLLVLTCAASSPAATHSCPDTPMLVSLSRHRERRILHLTARSIIASERSPLMSA